MVSHGIPFSDSTSSNVSNFYQISLKFSKIFFQTLPQFSSLSYNIFHNKPHKRAFPSIFRRFSQQFSSNRRRPSGRSRIMILFLKMAVNFGASNLIACLVNSRVNHDENIIPPVDDNHSLMYRQG